MGGQRGDRSPGEPPQGDTTHNRDVTKQTEWGSFCAIPADTKNDLGDIYVQGIFLRETISSDLVSEATS